MLYQECVLLFFGMISFNPCFIGTYSFTNFITSPFSNVNSCFNPCFIGTYSFTKLVQGDRGNKVKSFNPCFIGTYSFTHVAF